MTVDRKTLMVETGSIFSDKLDYYSHEWQDHFHDIIQLVPENSSVIDIGCGRGGLLEYLRANKNCVVTGLDISEEATRICKEKGMSVLECDIESEEIPGSYDVIILSAVLEHLIDPITVLKNLRKNLNENGYIIIGVPNFSHLKARIKYLVGVNVKKYGDDLAGNKLGIQPFVHIQFFNKTTLEYLLESTGYFTMDWAYHKTNTFRLNDRRFGLKEFYSWMIHKLYQIDHELFSVFITVKAKRDKG